MADLIKQCFTCEKWAPGIGEGCKGDMERGLCTSPSSPNNQKVVRWHDTCNSWVPNKTGSY